MTRCRKRTQDAMSQGDSFEQHRQMKGCSSKTMRMADSSYNPTARQETSQSGNGAQGDRTVDMVSIILDAETLDCPVCFEHLKPPIYQCSNGHVVCSVCHEKLTKKCSICSCETASIRCIALEKIINSVKFLCVNALYGCQALFTPSERGVHEAVCAYSPCFCPEQTCKFKGGREALIVHLKYAHDFPVEQFNYNTSVMIYVGYDPFVFLAGPDTSLFRVDVIKKAIGTTVSVVCIRSSNLLEPKFSCETTVTKWILISILPSGQNNEIIDGFIKLKYDVLSSTMEHGLESNGPYMLIPHCMPLSVGNFKLECCIEKKQ